MSQVEGVPSFDAVAAWPRVSHHIQRALDRYDSGYTLEDLLTAIQLRDKQLWIINGGQAAGITSIEALPQWKRLLVEYLGGDHMGQWADVWHETMQAYAKAHNCKYIEVRGREGWARIAKARGDRVESMTISRKHVWAAAAAAERPTR